MVALMAYKDIAHNSTTEKTTTQWKKFHITTTSTEFLLSYPVQPNNETERNGKERKETERNGKETEASMKSMKQGVKFYDM